MCCIVFWAFSCSHRAENKKQVIAELRLLLKESQSLVEDDINTKWERQDSLFVFYRDVLSRDYSNLDSLELVEIENITAHYIDLRLKVGEQWINEKAKSLEHLWKTGQ